MASSTSEFSRQGALSEPERVSVVPPALNERDGGRLKTSSIGFQDPSFDEPVHARRVARALLEPREAVDVERLPDLRDFRPETVERLLAEHESRQRDHLKKLYTLPAFQIWASRYRLE